VPVGSVSGTDTGGAVQGHHVDVYVPGAARARRFGKRMVWVQVLEWGNGEVQDEDDNMAERRAAQRSERTRC
jgi:hypothetical protein